MTDTRRITLLVPGASLSLGGWLRLGRKGVHALFECLLEGIVNWHRRRDLLLMLLRL